MQAAAEAESTSWIGTNYFQKLAPGAFVVPNLPKYSDAAGKARGAEASLALADPSYILAIDLYSSSAFLSKTLNSLPGSDYGGVWVLADMVTADQLTLTPTALGNSAGEFVAPTPETMTAAVTAMEPDASGILQLDPDRHRAVGSDPALPADLRRVRDGAGRAPGRRHLHGPTRVAGAADLVARLPGQPRRARPS